MTAETGSSTRLGRRVSSTCAEETFAAGGPAVGALADRFGNRAVGVVTAVANLVALLGLLLAVDRTGMLLTATLAGLTQPQVGPLVRVHWSRVLPRRLVPTALSYEAAADETSFVTGPVLIGMLLPFGPTAPVVATMVLLAAATVPFALVLTGSPTTTHGSLDAFAVAPATAAAGLLLALVIARRLR